MFVKFYYYPLNMTKQEFHTHFIMDELEILLQQVVQQTQMGLNVFQTLLLSLKQD